MIPLRYFATVAALSAHLAVGAPAAAQDAAGIAAATEAVSLARERIAAGDLKAALGPLERALLLVPGADEVRLLYADVLLRLGDAEGAQREAELLQGRLSGEAADAAEGLRERATAQSKALRAAGTVFAGVEASTDPSRGLRGGGGDTAAIGGLTFGIAYDILATGGGFAFAEFALRGELGHETGALDGPEGSLRLGLSLPLADLEVTPALSYRTSLLDDGTRSEVRGAGIDLRYGLSKRTEATLGLDWEEVDQAGRVLLDGSGDLRAATFGLGGKLGARSVLEASIGWTEFDGARPGADYDEPRALLGLSVELTGAMRVTGSLGYQETRFTEGSAREDREADVYLGLGASLAGLSPSLGDLSLQTGLRHRSRSSTIPSLSGEDTSIEILLVRGFEF